MKHFFTFVLLILTISTLAQTTDKISYQAIIRDSDNSLVAGSDIDIKILLRSGSSTGVVVYEEEHYTTTNINGLVTLQIGTGRVVKGSFSGISWDEAPFFIETQVDPTGKANFTVIGVSEILSVPYALYAKSVSTFDGTISQSQITDLQHFSGNYDDLQNKPEPFSRNYNDLLNLPNLYTSAEVDSLIVNAGSTGTVQSLDLQNDKLFISGGNSISFENWDTDSSDDFSGNYNDLLNLPNLYTTSEVDSLIVNAGSNGTVQSLALQDNKLSISGGNSISLENWDMDASDDFSGDYNDLQDKPVLFSGRYNDLIDLPKLYTTAEVDSLIVNAGSTRTVQSLDLQNNKLSISGGNSISFENWDTDSSDDFSGNYTDLQDKPVLFSGRYNDLINLPKIYTTEEVDSIIVNVGSTGTVQSLDLQDNRLSISGGNSISFENWDTDSSDDFSGNYDDLLNLPSLYTTAEVDSLVVNAGSTGIAQSLDLQDNMLSISGGNSISFENWDADATDDFSGNYDDLLNLPSLYTTAEVDSLIVNAGSTGTVQSLDLQDNRLSISGGNSISFKTWDTDASDDFSGNYTDLQDKPALFSGRYKDLIDLPSLYTTGEVDSLFANAGSTGTIQSLDLQDNKLSISGGNSISFENWDTDASDDFSGNYYDLQDKPELFSGNFHDLLNLPSLYTSSEVDSLIVNARSTGTLQSLDLKDKNLSISGGNSISFEEWDTDSSDDFSGNYNDLQNIPELFSGKYEDLQNKPESFSGDFKDLKNIPAIYTKTEVDNLINNNGNSEHIAQNLHLENENLTISGGNTVSYSGWDMNAADDFNGKYSSLSDKPELYTRAQVDSITTNLIKKFEKEYYKKPVIINLASSRSIKNSDIENTIACTISSTLTINSGFKEMAVGQIINIEIHGTTLTVKGATGVRINGVQGGSANVGNNDAYTGGILRKTGSNSYIVL